MRSSYTAAAVAALAFATVAQADTLYTNGFSGNAANFTFTGGDGGLATAPSGQGFVALYDYGSTATLTLDTSQYIGQGITLGFTLYGIGSVDGNAQYGGGAGDNFVVTGNATQLFNYNFANFSGNTQSYPANPSPADTGATATNTLGYSGFPGTVQDSTYGFTLAPFTVTGASTTISFTSLANEGRGNEFYGFDNVTVTGTPNMVAGTVPEPASWLMMIAGFGAIGTALRRRATPAFA